MPGWGWGGDPWAGLGLGWGCLAMCRTNNDDHEHARVSCLEVIHRITASAMDAMRQTPDSRASTPDFASPCHPARGVSLACLAQRPDTQHTHTHKPRMFSSLSHARPSFANPCMQASSPHPAPRPRLAMYNWSAPTWTVCGGCNQGSRPPPSHRPRLASPHRRAVRMGGAPAAATTRAPDFLTP